MGDRARFEVFAGFLNRNFPASFSVACVADGQGALSRVLAVGGREVVLIDPAYRGRMRGLSFRVERRLFVPGDRVEADLIVGLHPDGATGLIIREAVSRGVGWAIVPCCVMGPDAAGVTGDRGWIRALRSLAGPDHRMTSLAFRGKNTVLWGA